MAWVITGFLEGKRVYYEKWAGSSASAQQPFYGEWLKKVNICCIFMKKKTAVDLLDKRTEADASLSSKTRKVTGIKVELFDIGGLEAKSKTERLAEIGERKLKL